MKTINGNIWDFYNDHNWLVIPTNTITNFRHHAIMGKGMALDAKKRFKDIDVLYGKYLESTIHSSNPFFYDDVHLILFPTKYDWLDDSVLDLIKKNCYYMVDRVIEKNLNRPGTIQNVYLPALGCGCGGLKWEYIKEEISAILASDMFNIVLK